MSYNTMNKGTTMKNPVMSHCVITNFHYKLLIVRFVNPKVTEQQGKSTKAQSFLNIFE